MTSVNQPSRTWWELVLEFKKMERHESPTGGMIMGDEGFLVKDFGNPPKVIQRNNSMSQLESQGTENIKMDRRLRSGINLYYTLSNPGGLACRGTGTLKKDPF